jgi:hypothetical protein
MTAEQRDEHQRLVDRYLARLDERAAELGPFGRFYAYQGDDLERLEWAIQEQDPEEQALYNALIARYRSWLEEMAPGARHLLFAQNREREGRWCNTILEEELLAYDPGAPASDCRPAR